MDVDLKLSQEVWCCLVHTPHEMSADSEKNGQEQGSRNCSTLSKKLKIFSKNALLPLPELQTFIKLEFKLSSINQILSFRAFRRSAETSKAFQAIMRTRRAVQRRAPVCGWSTARPTRAVPPVVSLQPCRGARYACVACRGLGWYLALVALSKQRALLRRDTVAAVALPPHATAAGGSRHAAQGTRLAAHGGVACVFLLCEQGCCANLL